MTNTVDIILRSVDKASADIKKVNSELKKTEKTAGSMKGKIKATGMAVAGVTALLGTMALAGKQAFAWAEEGAMLDLSKTKLDRLARTIDTTGDALQRKLYKAMGGLASQTEAAALGTDLLSLGLVKSADDAARMAGVVGKLGMNMNQLVLTLTNQTTMRFDALGVSVDGFKGKVKELEKAGYAADEAFRMAFLEQAEEQVDKVGDVAETSAGQFMKLRAGWKDWTDAVKEDLAIAIVPAITEINNMRDAKALLREAVDMGIMSQSDYNFQIEIAKNGVTDLVEVANELVPVLDAAHAAMERTAMLPPIDLVSKLGIVEAKDQLDSIPGETAKSNWKQWSDEAIAEMILVQQWQGIIGDGITEVETAETMDLMDALGFGDRKDEIMESIGNFNTLGGDMSTALDNINKTVTPTIEVVAKGDTLSSIAKKYGQTVASILNMNPGITDADILSIGQEIRINSVVTLIGGSPDGRAGGGKLTGYNLVGEAGPELIIGNTVIPAGPTRRMLNAGMRPRSRHATGGELPTVAYDDFNPYSYENQTMPPSMTAYDWYTPSGKKIPGGSYKVPPPPVSAAAAPAAPAPPPVSIAEIATQTGSTAASVGVQMAKVITAEMRTDAIKSNQLQSEMLEELRKLPKVEDMVLAFRNAVEQAVS